MTLADILNLEKILSATVDFEKKTFDLTFLFITIKGLKLPQLKALKNDVSTIENILTELFLRKRVMWFDLRRETVDLCIESLKDLKDKCDSRAKEFDSTKKDKDKFYSAILKSWATECDNSVKDFMVAKEHESISRGEIEVDSYLYATDEIPKIIGTFRARTLPIVIEFINILPIDNKIKIDSTKLYNQAKDELIRFYKIDSELIKDGDWVMRD